MTLNLHNHSLVLKLIEESHFLGENSIEEILGQSSWLPHQLVAGNLELVLILHFFIAGQIDPSGPANTIQMSKAT